MMARRKLICQWRVSRALPSGLQVWFDPSTETIKLFELEPHPPGGVADALEGDERDEIPESSSSNDEIGQSDLPF